MAALHRRFAGIDQKEAARAVCILRLTGGKTALPEESRLLIPRHAGDGDFSAQQAADAVAVGRRIDLREHGPGDIQFLQEFVVPL